ncbi:MAG: HlyD family type I secretion periplasmic adaptor subunit [Hyphomicrobiales bacterium]
MSDMHAQSKDWSDTVPASLRAPTLFGLFTLIVSVAGFGIWAVTAPLQSAVVASGRFVATGQNKVVQHLEGGIVRHIRVKEGDHVKRGDVLVSLDDTGSTANLQLLNHRYHRLKAQQARLITESKWSEEIQFPTNLMAAAYEEGDDDVRLIMGRQREEFRARREKLIAETAILNQEIATRKEAITGFGAEIDSIGMQLRLIDEEVSNKTQLYKQKLVLLPNLLALKRARAQLFGRSARLKSNIAEEKKGIIKTRGQIIHLRAVAVDQAVAELRRIEAELDDIQEQQRKARDVLQRINIKAPVDAVVVKLMHHTQGAVVKPGGEIMELVPVDDEPIIEARVQPRDIDKVENGQVARVRLTALNQRLTPTVTGHVIYVSADTLEDRRGGSDLGGYVVRVRLETEKVAALEDFRPIPGMPVETYIETGERTFFDYLMRPLVDSMARAFRES